MIGYSDFQKLFIQPVIEAREGLDTRTPLMFLRESEKWSREQLLDYQWERIKLILKHAYQNSPFYRDRFDKESVHPEDIRSRSDFERIPFVTREDLNEHLHEMLAINIPEEKRHYASTGGSTGLATRFARDNACLSIKKSCEYRFNMWAGWRPGEKILSYWPALTDFGGGTSRFPLTKARFYSRHLRLYAGRLNDEILRRHQNRFKKFHPHLVRAFPCALEQLALFVKEDRLDLPNPRAIVSVGEPLLHAQRKLFEEVFGCKVHNCYVSRECGNIASECMRHQGLHVAEELVYMEILGRGDGGLGEVVLTDLWNLGMPLIRYRIQDCAGWMQGECECGRKLRRIGVDAARVSDFLISPVDGAFVSGSSLIHYLLAEGPRIGRVKLVQDGRDHLTILITGDAASSRDSATHIRKRLGTIFQGKMGVDIRYVDSIPLLKSGKYSFVERTYKIP